MIRVVIPIRSNEISMQKPPGAHTIVSRPTKTQTMDSLMRIHELSLQLASFLTPTDAFNLLMTNRLWTNSSSSIDVKPSESIPASFINESLIHSLLSVIGQREGLQYLAEPLIKGLEHVAHAYGNDQLVIAGSLIVQAVTNNGRCAQGDGFVASDIDLYTTVTALSYTRSYLNVLGFILTGISTSDYTFMDHKIHHVESYSLLQDYIHIRRTTVGDAVRRSLIASRHDFVVDANSPYVMPLDFSFAPEDRRLRKQIDLVVTSSATVKDTLHKFDIMPCMSHFNGVNFCIPDLNRILRKEAMLRCPNWTSLLNRYMYMYLNAFPLSGLEQISFFRPNDAKVRFAELVFGAIRECGDYLPNQDGIFLPTSNNEPELSEKYCIILHNMLVKISQRVLKYNKRGFYFTDITVDELNQKHYHKRGFHFTDITADEISHQQIVPLPPRYKDGSSSVSKPKSQINTSDTVKRVKLLHRKNLPSPARRAKLRNLDRNGVNTSPFYNLNETRIVLDNSEL